MNWERFWLDTVPMILEALLMAAAAAVLVLTVIVTVWTVAG